ncbi:MAG: hypothetical protein ABEJ57_04970 [Halobacteriaceae archaeon]
MDKGDELAIRFGIDAVVIAIIGAILVGVARMAVPERTWIVAFLVGLAAIGVLAILLFGHIEALIAYRLAHAEAATDTDDDPEDSGFVWTDTE